MVSPTYGSSSGYQSNSIYSQYVPQGATAQGSPMSGGQSATSLADQFSSTMTSSAPPKQESGGGLFDKIGATIKGVVKAPGQLLKGAVNAIKDPKTWLMVGAAALTGPVGWAALGAYGAFKGGQAAVQGVGQTLQGWQTGDLAAIENGTSQAVAGAAGAGLSAVGVRSAVGQVAKTNPGALGASEAGTLSFKGPAKFGGTGEAGVAATELTAMQSLRATPKLVKNSVQDTWAGLKGDSTGAKLSDFKTQAVDKIKGVPDQVKGIRSDIQAQTASRTGAVADDAAVAAQTADEAAVAAQTADDAAIAATDDAAVATADDATIAAADDAVQVAQTADDAATAAADEAAAATQGSSTGSFTDRLKGLGSSEGRANAFQQVQTRFNNSRLGDTYQVLNGRAPGSVEVALGGAVTTPDPQALPQGGVMA